MVICVREMWAVALVLVEHVELIAQGFWVSFRSDARRPLSALGSPSTW